MTCCDRLFLLLLFRELIQNGLLYECSSDPWEVHWLLPSPWAHVRPLIINCPPGRPHAAFRQCRHESGTPSICFFCVRLLFWNIRCFETLRKQYLTNLLIRLFFFSLSSSQSSLTPLIRPTPWPNCVVLPTRRSVSVQEANTMTWMMLVRMSTTTPSSRCWGPGPLETTLR